MGHFSMEIYAPTGSNLSGNQHASMTQSQLAEKLGEYQSFVARLESGQRRIDVIEYIEIARVLNFDAAKALKKLAL